MCNQSKDVELISSEAEAEKKESSESSPLNPLTKKNYADEISKSMEMLLSYEDSLLRKFIGRSSLMKKDEKKETTSYVNDPLNPITNDNYADEIHKSNMLRELYEEELLAKSSKNLG